MTDNDKDDNYANDSDNTGNEGSFCYVIVVVPLNYFHWFHHIFSSPKVLFLPILFVSVYCLFCIFGDYR